MEETSTLKPTLVVYAPVDAEIADIKQALAFEFPNHGSIVVIPPKGEATTRKTYINFDSQEAYTQAAVRVGETISICGSTSRVVQHFSKPVHQQPKPAFHAEESSKPNPVVNQLPTPVTLDKAHLWYFWDIENVQIPKRIAAEAAYVHDLVTAIRKNCEILYPNHMHMDFNAMYAQRVLSDTAREGLHLCNVIVQQYPGKQVKKEQADKFIVTTMNTKEHLTKEYYENRVFVLITNDGGYQNDLHLLREKGITIILIHGAQASPIFKRSVDHCIPCDKIFMSVKTPTPNANVKYQPSAKVPELKLDLEISDDKVEGFSAKSQAAPQSSQTQSQQKPFPVPSSSRSRSRSRSRVDHSDSNRRGQSREPQARAQSREPQARAPQMHSLRVNLPQSLGVVTQQSLRVSFGPDAQIFIRAFKADHRHAIINFDSVSKASQFAGKEIPVNGQFVKVILLNQNSSVASNPPPVPPNPPKAIPNPPKAIVTTIQLTYPKYMYIIGDRHRISHLCQNVKTTFDDNRCTIKLEGLPEPMRKANNALTKFRDNIGQETISDITFNWFAAKLFLRYHMESIVIGWSVSLFLYRNGDEKPVTALNNYKNATDAEASYYAVIVGYINQPGIKEAEKYIKELQLQEPEILDITPQHQVDLFKSEPGKDDNKLMSISREHHCYIDVFNNKAQIYAFTEKELEGARKALERQLITTDKINLNPAKNEYIRRYKTAELEAIRRKHYAVRITGAFSDKIKTNNTESKRGTIILEGPSAYVTKAKVDVMELVTKITVENVKVTYPLRYQNMALRRFKSLAGDIQSHQDVVLDISTKSAAKDTEIVMHVVGCGEASVLKDIMDKFSVINFLAKDIYKIPTEQILPKPRQLNKLRTSTLEDFNVVLYFRLDDRAIDMEAEDSEQIASARANIDAFLKGENSSESFIIQDPRHRSWFEKFKDEKDLSGLGTEYRVWINPETKNGDVYYKISGPQKNIEGALAALKAYTTKLTSPLRTVPVKIERQKAETILAERRRVREIESKYQVDILSPKREFHVTIRSTNQVIEAVLGDITLEKVDAIVNAANSRLDHSGGMAKTIADAAGQQFITDCHNYIVNYGTIPTGQAIGTSAGDLRKNGVRFVIHAVGPAWKAGTSNEKEYLFAAISNALTFANTMGCKTIAIPPVSTGIYGFPHDKAAKIIVDAVIKTLPKTEIHKVRIIDFQPTSMPGSPVEEGEDDDVEDDNPVNSTSLYAMIRNELKDRRKELESDDDTKSDLSVLSLPKFQPLSYQWFWKEDAGGKHFKGQPWIMYDHDQSVEIEEAWKKWNNSPMNASSSNNQRPLGILDWIWQSDKDKHAQQTMQTPPSPLQPSHPPLQIVGDVGGVKAGVMYEILFSTDGNHNQRNVNTGHKRPIKRKDIDIPDASTTSSTQVASVPNTKKPSALDYKYWKELLEFTITGHRDDIPAVIKDLEALAKDFSEALHMGSKWGFIGKAEREAAVREIASRLYVDAEIQPGGQVIKLSGQESSIHTVRAEIYKWAFERSNNIGQDIPSNWTSFDESENCVLVSLHKDGQEWSSVVSRIAQTMANATVKRIQRVQNRHLWATFQHNHRHISKKNSGSVNTLPLFHGSRSAIPSSIYLGEEGFDPRFSALGMWGKGCYFAVNASYSANYAYADNSKNYKQFFLAEVITGDSVLLPQDNTLVMPPLKPRQNGQFVNERYDSVKGSTGGSDIYIVYSMGRFYPTYLITYV